MGNKQNRQRAKEVALAAEWERVRNSERPFVSDVTLPRIGLRRVQIIVAPAFEPGFAWDLRQLSDKWRVFRSEVVDHDLLSGYEELEASHLPLEDWFRSLSQMTLQLCPLLNGMDGLDGTLHQLEVAGDMHSALRICWWSEYPPEWEHVIHHVRTMVGGLQACSPEGA